LTLSKVVQNYSELRQRFFSLQECNLSSSNCSLKVIYNIFVESSKTELDTYIHKFKENERAVMKAKRNINRKKNE
jgi:hypothetical protein